MRRRKSSIVFVLAMSLSVAGSAQDGVPLCDQHPPVGRALEAKAKNETKGVQSLHLEALRNRSAPGIQVELNPGRGGGDCPGHETTRGRAAEAVGALLYGGQLHCSAVLVAPSTIVTAAHCVKGFDLAKMEFVVGEDAQAPIQRSLILDGDTYQDYDATRFGVHDLAFLHLKKFITEVEPISYARSPLKLQTPRLLLHVGYGVAGAEPGRRRCVDIPINTVCDRGFSSQTPNLNTCNGDSGGGVFYNDGGEIRLIGITNWGDELCRDYDISLDIGSYQNEVGNWIFSAEKNVGPAKVEPKARTPASPTAATAIRDSMKAVPVWQQDVIFNVRFKGRWIQRWQARMRGLPVASRFGYPNSCDVFVETQGISILLLGLEGGCDLKENSQLPFDGRLFTYHDNYFELTFPELTSDVNSGTTAGAFSLVEVSPSKRVVSERRTQGFRLESEHGEWSGRKDECKPVTVDLPWKLDRSQPITVAFAYQNHAGLKDDPNKMARDNGFCIPLWAEGFGGARAFGVQVDAGSMGVVSGSASFAVFREEETSRSTEIRSGSLATGTPVQIAVPDRSKEYELHLKLVNGREIVARQSLHEDGVFGIDWDRGAGEIRVTLD